MAKTVLSKEPHSSCSDRIQTLLEICFEASLQQDELRRVAFRLALCDVDTYTADTSPIAAIQAFAFEDPAPLTAMQLRKLAPSVGFSRGLIVANADSAGHMLVTGILHTGASWLRVVQGGRGSTDSTPHCLIIHVLAPGCIEARWGNEIIAQLKHGTVVTEQLDVFQSRWPSDSFAGVRVQLAAEFERRIQSSPEERVTLDPMFFARISQQMLKRSIAVIQGLRHGGTLIIAPQSMIQSRPTFKHDVRIRNQFRLESISTSGSKKRSRHQELMLMAADLLTTLGADISRKSAGWDEYAQLSDERLNRLDEALFEEAYLMGGLTGTDGAVVMNDRFEVLGFGAEIDCHDAELTTVFQGMDLEGVEKKPVPIDQFGTRHRSAFRLVKKYPQAVAIVVSQDGDVRFVCNRDDAVVFFEHEAAMVVELVL